MLHVGAYAPTRCAALFLDAALGLIHRKHQVHRFRCPIYRDQRSAWLGFVLGRVVAPGLAPAAAAPPNRHHGVNGEELAVLHTMIAAR
jgi:hypothetical protein